MGEQIPPLAGLSALKADFPSSRIAGELRHAVIIPRGLFTQEPSGIQGAHSGANGNALDFSSIQGNGSLKRTEPHGAERGIIGDALRFVVVYLLHVRFSRVERERGERFTLLRDRLSQSIPGNRKASAS